MLWFVTCFFNPAHFKKPLRNFDIFAKRLKAQGGKLLTVELAFEDEPFELPEQERHIRLRSQSVLWQKERLLNYAISQLPAECDKVCWIDCDILFENPSFLEMAEEKLDHTDVIQMFDTNYRLYPDQVEWTNRNPTGQKLWTAKSIAHMLLTGQPTTTATMGFAWAARMEFLREVGLYDRGVLGGGDSVMTNAIFNRPQACFTKEIDAAISTWTNQCRAFQPRTGTIPARICHLWHGKLENRKYFDRTKILTSNRFDPASDIYCINHVWEWGTIKPQLHSQIREYFLNRQEDLVG